MNNSIKVVVFSACTFVNAFQSHAQGNDSVWVSIDPVAAKHYQQNQRALSRNEQILSVQNTKLNTVNLLKVEKQNIAQLSEFMHHNYNRCGGFVAHDSLTEAKQYTDQLASVQNQKISTAFAYSIDNSQTVQGLINQISANNLTNTVNTLTNFNNRYYTSQTGVDASQWLKGYWQQLTSSRSDISVDYFTHSWSQSSVLVTINGNEEADDIVIIGGHLDSINQSNPSNGRSPGADDNASGIAVLTEALRAVVEQNYKPQKTIKIMAFAAEEVGLRGSKDIASAFKSQGKNVVGMVQFDMTGNNGSSEDIVMMTDYTTAAQNQYLGQLITTYLPDITYGFDQCGYGCSDHASWYQQGFAASIPFESRMNDINTLIHTENDEVFDADHASKFAKLAVSYLAEMAKNAGDVAPPANNELQNGVTVSAITANAKAQLIYTLQVPNNVSDLNFTTAGGSGDADLYVKFNTPPTLNSFDCKSTTSTSSESCDISSPQVGVYYVMLEAWNAIANVSLKGSYNEASIIEPINTVEANVNVSSGNWTRFIQDLGPGYSSLNVSMSGGTGDADLYLNFNNQSSESVYLCRPYKNGNAEACSITNPQEGKWHIDLKGYSVASGMTLTISAR
ncbi:M20/M25/M40 family metallo-hydrolase [Pseudoalteromonas sp. SWXJ133]|uniref:M28 family metallopeptidase n=1 Tax=unclassified Pseudoalteromonas TaxID=194690 RepID=UPI001409E4B4|nr:MULTISPECIES: M28 family metallopeptidase [unclassified Pseudoalteromonas]MBH0020936.1 M20/M25/M40 family metallo-hydrolase [Pseudoalteromonas sp. SWXJ133]